MANKTKSFAQYCREENKPQLLALYDDSKSLYSAEEISYSAGRKKPCTCTCPVCGSTWTDYPNKLNQRRPGNWNYFTNSEEITYCPYCKGERLSSFYNILTIHPELEPYYDFAHNPLPEDVSPATKDEIIIKCRHEDCDYSKAVSAQGFVRRLDRYRCPKCENGYNSEVNEWNCLATTHPHIADELVDARNNGHNKWNISASSRLKLWFQCKHGHYYQAWVRNRCYRDDGCPICNERNGTSFFEQALFFYIQKCFGTALNRFYDPRTGYEIDIFIPSLNLAFEYSSLYQHRARRKDRVEADKQKLKALTSYYKVYLLQEYPPEFQHPLLQTREMPVYQNRSQYDELNRIILEVLKDLDPNRDRYPGINLDRDELKILQQFIHTDVKDSFADRQPIHSSDWDRKRNGHLTPSMFTAGNGSYKFWWECRSCERPYRALMTNKVKQKDPDKCPLCARADAAKQGGVTLGECYPQVLLYWHWTLNDTTPDMITANSEQTGIFRLPDGRCVPVQISNLTSVLRNRPDTNLEQYLEKVYKRTEKQWNIASTSEQ